jgi:pimeloyl-ACP methyl ester carboxylesterase
MKIITEFQPSSSRPTAPTIISCHGMMGSIAQQDILLLPDWRELVLRFNLLRFDFRGHGRSVPDLEPKNYYWSSLGDDLTEIAVKEHDTSQIILLGESMGAAACLYAALTLIEQGRPPLALVLAIPPTSWEYRNSARALLRN